MALMKPISDGIFVLIIHIKVYVSFLQVIWIYVDVCLIRHSATPPEITIIWYLPASNAAGSVHIPPGGGTSEQSLDLDLTSTLCI